MPTNPAGRQPRTLSKGVNVSNIEQMYPQVESWFDGDVDDNEVVTLGDPTLAQYGHFKIIVDYGAAVAEAFVDNDGDAVVVNEVGTSTSKFTSTIGATNAQYQFGIDSGSLQFKNTDGANKTVQIIRIT